VKNAKRVLAPVVRVGQVWEDNDKRTRGRTLRVVRVEGRRVVCDVFLYGGFSRQTNISIERFRPTSTGYRLLHEDFCK
jgi:hypothetical protein